jgi:eukaryotic-like serine/threonine-protein kinase
MADVTDTSPECESCGGTVRSADGTCLQCFLAEGLKSEGEASRETFASILAEAEMPGKPWRLGQYEILEEIGRGGMGVIYRARQRHSRRIVAVKRIMTHDIGSNETLIRFRREAESAARLDHPNIIPIYEVSESEDGLPFFSMKYATGGSLRAALSALREKPRECVQLIAKIARAMAYAHDQGILHRDLQPGNILLDGNGEPLVSDFGLAKRLDKTSDLTRTLTTFGTPGYVAPEQAEWAAADLTPAADIYSLGAILFHLLAGRPPFVGSSLLSVIHQAAATSAPGLRTLVPSIDRDLETIVARCLEREPRARYQSSAVLAEDLDRWLEGRPIHARPISLPLRTWRWARRNPILAATATACLFLAIVVVTLMNHSNPTAVPERSVAVLPFDNMGGDPENAYFADGIKDEIVIRLSKIATLKVIARDSTQQFAGGSRNVREITRRLGVANILQGNIRKSDQTLRVTVQLIDGNAGYRWSETYDRKPADLFQVEAEIAERVATALEATLTGSERLALASRPTGSVEAYHAYLKGRYFWNKRTIEGFREAAEHFSRAIEIDPAYAQACVGLADAILFLGGNDPAGPKESVRRGRALLQRALELDGTLADAHASLGLLALNSDWDWAVADREFKRAIELDPNYATAHQWYGEFLAYMGRFDEAIAESTRARELDPLSLIISTDVAKVYFVARRYDEAIADFQAALKLDPEFAEAHWILALTYGTIGKHEEALAELRKIKNLESNSVHLSCLAFLHGVAGRKEEARATMRRLNELSVRTYVSPLWMAIASTGIGDKDEAFKWFERAFAEHAMGGAVSLKVNPIFDSLRSDPRFADLLRRANLPP